MGVSSLGGGRGLPAPHRTAFTFLLCSKVEQCDALPASVLEILYRLTQRCRLNEPLPAVWLIFGDLQFVGSSLALRTHK